MMTMITVIMLIMIIMVITMKINNLVAKNARRFNKAAVHTDRKKASKRVRGQKHKHASN